MLRHLALGLSKENCDLGESYILTSSLLLNCICIASSHKLNETKCFTDLPLWERDVIRHVCHVS